MTSDPWCLERTKTRNNSYVVILHDKDTHTHTHTHVRRIDMLMCVCAAAAVSASHRETMPFGVEGHENARGKQPNVHQRHMAASRVLVPIHRRLFAESHDLRRQRCCAAVVTVFPMLMLTCFSAEKI